MQNQKKTQLNAILVHEDIIDATIRLLPNLPSTLRYYDDFDSEFYAVKDFSNLNQAVFRHNGLKNTTYFDFNGDYAIFGKHLFLFMLQEDFNIVTACNYIATLRSIGIQELREFIDLNPNKLKSKWTSFLSQNQRGQVYSALKVLLKLLCTYNIREWADHHLPMIKSLPFPYVDKHAAVRLGDVFINIDEENRIVNFIDDFALLLSKDANSVTDTYLEDVAMLMCCYLYGFRPIQIASVRLQDVRIWDNFDDGETSVHITFKTVKQKSASKAFPQIRKIKYEWAIIILELCNRHKKNDFDERVRLFRTESAYDATFRIAKLATSVSNRYITSRYLRHSAAQLLRIT